MSDLVHPTAIVGSDVILGEGVSVGAYSVIEGRVDIGAGAKIASHVAISGHTTIGAGTRIFPFASVGHEPQDQKFGGEESFLTIGDNCIIREHVTLNPGTVSGGLYTRVGNECLIMVGAHVAHDCQIGNNCILVNNVLLGGHVEIDDWAIIGGGTGVHQFVKIGRHAMIGGASALGGDVIPYGLARGNLASLDGLNLVGLKRRKIGRDSIQTLRRAYRFLFGPEGTMEEKVADAAKLFDGEEGVSEVLDFIRASGSRGLCTPKQDVG